MRTLSDTLLAAQQGTAQTEYVRVFLTSAGGGGGTTYTFTTDDVPNRLKKVISREEVYGSAVIITLGNYDGYFNDKNFKGYKVNVGWGFNTGTLEYSNMQDLWVFSQKEVSDEGVLHTELGCIDLWNLLSKSYVFTGGTRLTGSPTSNGTNWKMGEKLIGATSTAYGYIFNVTDTYIDVCGVIGTFQTENVATASGSLSITGAVPSTIASGKAPMAWSGTHVEDIVSLILTGWASLTLDSDDPLSKFAAYTPNYIAPMGTNLRAVLVDMLRYTRNGMRMVASTMHSLYLNPSPSADYNYNASHVAVSNNRDRRLVTPNRIYVISSDPVTKTPEYIGSAVDSTSYAEIGKYINQIVIDESVGSDADATAVATSLITRANAELNTGEIRTRIMNVGQELLDWVTVTDYRNSEIVISGRVGAIERRYEPGVYGAIITLGGLSTSADLDASGVMMPGSAVEGTATTEQVQVTHPSIIPFNFAPAILPIVSNVVFSSSAYNAVAWAAGTDVILFADGSKQSVVSGTATSIAAKTWVYGTIGSTTLVATSTFSDTIGANKFIVAILKPGAAGDKALIVQGRDDLVAGQLSAIAADIGLVTAGEVRVGTGTLGSDYTGWRLWVESSIGRFAGYQNNVMQFYSGTDGKLYAGGGYVLLDSAGVTIDASGGAIGRLNLKYGGTYTDRYITLTSLGHMYLWNGSYALDWSGSYGYALEPSTANYVDLGSATMYFDRVYADVYYGKTTTIQAFDKQDDLALIKSIKTKKASNKKEGKSGGRDRYVIDIESLPEDIVESETDPETGEVNKFVVLGGIGALALGGVRQLTERLEELEAEVKRLKGGK